MPNFYFTVAAEYLSRAGNVISQQRDLNGIDEIDAATKFSEALKRKKNYSKLLKISATRRQGNKREARDRKYQYR